MSLWSFEGAVCNRITFTSSGGHSGGGTPLPIPNRAVKPASADGTRRATSRESRSPPDYLQKGRRRRPFVVLGSKGGAPRRLLPAPSAGDRGRGCACRRVQGRGDRP